MKSITGNELQEQLLNEFFDTAQHPSQHDFAARAEILALQERVKELESTRKGGTAKAEKSEKGD